MLTEGRITLFMIKIISFNDVIVKILITTVEKKVVR